MIPSSYDSMRSNEADMQCCNWKQQWKDASIQAVPTGFKTE